MGSRLYSVFCAALLLAACSQKNPSARLQANSTQTNQDAPVVATSSQAATAPGDQRRVNEAAAPGAASQTPVRPPAQPTIVTDGSDMSSILGQLTQALRKYSVEHQRVPASLSEVAAAGYLSAMPKPPPGKRFAIDQDHVQVVLKPL